jgi:hypothetical protein
MVPIASQQHQREVLVTQDLYEKEKSESILRRSKLNDLRTLQFKE